MLQSVDKYNSLAKQCEKRLHVCKGCEEQYISNVSHVMCSKCNVIYDEISLRTAMCNTWSKLRVYVTYWIHHEPHKETCTAKNKLVFEDKETTIEYSLLKKFKSMHIDSTGRVIDGPTERYQKDDEIMCRCGQKITYTVLSITLGKIVPGF